MHQRFWLPVSLLCLLGLLWLALPATAQEDEPMEESPDLDLPPSPVESEADAPAANPADEKARAALQETVKTFQERGQEILARYHAWVASGTLYARPAHANPRTEDYPWGRHLAESREAYDPVRRAFVEALRAGIQLEDPDLREAVRAVEDVKRQFSGTGVFFVHRLDEPPIAEDDALEGLYDEAYKGLMAARSGFPRWYVEERWQLIDRRHKLMLQKNQELEQPDYQLAHHPYYQRTMAAIQKVRETTLPLLEKLPLE